MNAPDTAIEITATPGMPFAGGFYLGRIRQDDGDYALILAPKAEGERDSIIWNKSLKTVEGALSYYDGAANTQAMAAAGSALAKWALGLTIGGFEDWYLPSQDELELAYRQLKPGTVKNDCWARSGINLNSLPPAYPYTPSSPVQTSIPAFQSGGAEDFEESWYWTSTQSAGTESCAWCQGFDGGVQDGTRKDDHLRARAVRRSKI